MNTKPIKRNKNIVKLSQDHHASLLFCWKLRKGIKYHANVQTMVDYVSYFWDHHFSLHFREEEEFLFAPLKDKVVMKAMDDHQKIETLIREINFTGTENQEDVLLELAGMVDEHVRYEERILFPHLEKELSEEQLLHIGTQISGELLKDNYGDTFWIKKES